MRIFYLLVAFSLSFSISIAQTLNNNFPGFDGQVTSILTNSDTIFVGGTFTNVLKPDSSSQYGGAIDTLSGLVYGAWAKPNGTVFKAISDGNKGAFICGDFTRVGSITQIRIAHLDSNGNVTSKLAGIGANGRVNDLFFKERYTFYRRSFHRSRWY